MEVELATFRSDARVAEGGALLRRYTGLNPYREFESLSLRHLFHREAPIRAALRVFFDVVPAPLVLASSTASIGDLP